ncbi:hypothetical protein WR25_18282 isoform E [Diploscapter pachys]|uniref:BTB domain-containing protein n=1 Tax=Diploscapter pachys TaxID=2018661 RepID=A0A2A2LEG4_9BILA|nr:hypothetical protein WR25_18282 isoform A [Diploscapter pachys]PAV84461.1 hypothetical protein WR25_18282 isoform E [Diploscapter pachys]
MSISRWTCLSLVPEGVAEKIKLAVIFGSSGSDVIFVTTDDEVFSFGPCAASCLGCPPGSFLPRRIDELCGKAIRDISCGIHHVVALTEEGKIFSWGSQNSFGELGHGHSSSTDSRPQQVQGVLNGEKVVAIACGSRHTLAVSDKGELFSFGLNSDGQLGTGRAANESSPRIVPLHNRFVKSVACGHNNSMALTESGDVYVWGYNSNGELGLGHLTNQHCPILLDSLSKKAAIRKIACGYAHSLALSDDGILYAWGTNTSCGILEGKMARKNVLVPTVTQEQLGSISDIAATHQCNLSAACTRKSRVFMWGHLRNQPTPCAVETQFRTVDEVFACFASPAVSPRAISFLEMTQSPLLLSIRNAFNDPTHCDMKIIVEGKAIHVHKALLKIRCQYFRVRLGELWHDSNENTLEVKDFPYNVYKAFLHWLYTDELNVDLEEALGKF